MIIINALKDVFTISLIFGKDFASKSYYDGLLTGSRSYLWFSRIILVVIKIFIVWPDSVRFSSFSYKIDKDIT